MNSGTQSVVVAIIYKILQHQQRKILKIPKVKVLMSVSFHWIIIPYYVVIMQHGFMILFASEMSWSGSRK